jgi:hypothetical protein
VPDVLKKLLCRLFGHRYPVLTVVGWLHFGEEFARQNMIDFGDLVHARPCVRCGKPFAFGQLPGGDRA